ncbi:MAG: dihydrolipoyl dehydrogenase [Proteobacteria bacterium]|nr:dihydrolipoyl dehydrogenase [Pseudomonadota bacterium]
MTSILIIGAGPGGYVAALRASQLGFNVTIIDKRPVAGGTCLNVGCIPSKALLHTSYKYYETQHYLHSFGIYTDQIRFDLNQMMTYKNRVVEELTKGIAFLFKKNNITFVQGEAKLISPTQVKVHETIYSADSIIIATGSTPLSFPNIDMNEKDIVSSTGALCFEKVPDHLVIIGGGYIGLELGSVWARLGAKVTVVECTERIASTLDLELALTLQKNLEKQGLTFKLKSKLLNLEKKKDHLEVILDSESEPLLCDKVLMSVGRKAYMHNLGLEEVNIDLDEKGFIKVNGYFQTNIPSIYAIGDVIGGALLAHKAEEEGIAVVERLAGQKTSINYSVIPSIVYTHPEVACVGKTEEELKNKGITYKVGKFPFSANSRAKATSETIGFVKVLADAKTDQVLGVHIINEVAGHLIAEAVAIMEFKGSSEDIARICHAHPTHSEALKEAAWSTFSKAIHL